MSHNRVTTHVIAVILTDADFFWFAEAMLAMLWVKASPAAVRGYIERH